MIWEMENRNGYQWYKSDVCNLKTKSNGDTVDVWLNYKGYNIIMPMEIWGFTDEISERAINFKVEGDDMTNWYYVVKEKDLRLFIDLIYFFIREHNADKMISANLRINKWN